VAEELGVIVRSVYARAKRLERDGHRLERKSHGIKQVSPEMFINASKARISTELSSGVVIVGSDAHLWPGEKTTAMQAFLKLIRELSPKQVHLNGDVFDGARLSRFPKIGFLESAPEVKDEIEACQKITTEIEDACPRAKKFWELGNHDLRFESYLAARVNEFQGIRGFHLKDWFPKWTPCWATHINGDSNGHTVVKHRFRGGKYDAPNNVMNAHVSMITGHTHALKVWPMSTYRKHTIYGVNTGTLSEPYAEQFVHYTEDNPADVRSGFAVLTFWKGILLPPELCEVIDEGTAVFRGEILKL